MLLIYDEHKRIVIIIVEMEDIIRKIVLALGGKENINSVNNCMTRLRISVKDDNLIDEQSLKNIDTIMGVVHNESIGTIEIVVGPGKSLKYANACKEYINSNNNKKTKLTFADLCKTLGEIFVPLIPGTIIAGICAGFCSLLEQLCPNYATSVLWGSVFYLLKIVSNSFMTYISAWAGYKAAEKFGATPILGGMLGMVTCLEQVNDLAKLIGLYNVEVPLESILRVGRGGVVAVIFGVYMMSKVEKKIRSIMPDALDTVFSPLLTFITCLVPMLFVIMPLLGYVSALICDGIGYICMSEYLIVRIIAGYISAATFLFLVANGMHHGLVALYALQLEQIGYITLYPALAMAGASQIGAAIAIRMKAKKQNNQSLIKTIDSAIVPGLLGVGEPLIYGVTMPLGKPFILAGLGAGFGGAFVTALKVASTTWGPSGLLGVFVMTAGPNKPFTSVLYYVIGLLISAVCAYIIISLSKITFDNEENYACCKGEIIAMKDIPDKVFASGMMGECFGIKSEEEYVIAPADGTIEVIANSGHSFCMTCKDETKLLVHIGIDTVNLNGEGFTVHKKVGDKVKANEKIISFDRKTIKDAGYNDLVIVVKLKS